MGVKEIKMTLQERIENIKKEIETCLNEDDFETAAAIQVYLLKLMMRSK